MTNFLKYMLLSLAVCIGFASCSDDDDPEPQPQQLEVNYINLAGEWTLVSYNGHALDENTYMRIVFERRDHVFQMYDNLQSMYGQERTGTYLLTKDEKTETTILSGFYDNGVGAWSNEYTVTSLTADQLQLTSVGEPHEVQEYARSK